MTSENEHVEIHVRSRDMCRPRKCGSNMASNGEVANKLEKLQYQLEGFIENLRTVGVIAGDFQQNGQNNFNEKL